ncbi:MAG: hypothetical protein RhofKO_10740 [Rhodothermales bacterium]
MRRATAIWFVLLTVGVLTASVPSEAQAQLTLKLENYAELPITATPGGRNTMAQLARVNFMRDEPGTDRFFVNDLNGSLYLLDDQTRTPTPYLDFNGKDGRPGLFQRFIFEQNFATGLTNVIFDPAYESNGIFYTLHFEDPSSEALARPRPDAVAGLDLSSYATTDPIPPTPEYDGPIAAEVVLIEWTDRNTANTTFEGTAREILRVEHFFRIHPMGEMGFNPYAQPGDADWRVMYIGVGDASTGDATDEKRQYPQRLDSFYAKVLRIIPDPAAHMATSRLSANGQYRIPDDNPYTEVEGARGEVWASGIRNPHRFLWHRSAGQDPQLLAFNIGSTMWETVVIVEKGANYGYPFREGPEARSEDGAEPIPAEDVLPVLVSSTVQRGTTTPTYPVIAYKTHEFGDAIANGFIYQGSEIPALTGKLVFGDITTGRGWYADLADVWAADDNDPETLAPLHPVTWDLHEQAEAAYRARGGEGEALPGRGRVAGQGRVDLRFAQAENGDVFVLTKGDGMIRRVTEALPNSAQPTYGTSNPGASDAWIVPDGFRVTTFAENVENARTLALGAGGTVFVGSRTSDKVHAVIDNDGDFQADRVLVIASGLDQPNGIALRHGALYVATADQVLRYDDIEAHLEAPPTPIVVRDNLTQPRPSPYVEVHRFRPG